MNIFLIFISHQMTVAILRLEFNMFGKSTILFLTYWYCEINL